MQSVTYEEKTFSKHRGKPKNCLWPISVKTLKTIAVFYKNK